MGAVEFRERLWATIRALRPLLGDGVLIVGSEVPNLAPADAPLPAVVSQDIDLGIEVQSHGRVKAALPRDLCEGYVFEDPALPLLVFGRLSLVLPGVETTTPGGTVRLADRILRRLEDEDGRA
jgi:hypothetical protein